jgi:hypothetical protein
LIKVYQQTPKWFPERIAQLHQMSNKVGDYILARPVLLLVILTIANLFSGIIYGYSIAIVAPSLKPIQHEFPDIFQNLTTLNGTQPYNFHTSVRVFPYICNNLR